MKKKVIFEILLILLFLIGFSFSNFALAGSETDDTDTALDSVITSMQDVNKINTSSGTKVKKVINGVIRLIQIAGTGIAAIVIVIVGIKYIMASPSAKADYKKTALPIVIGCVLIAAATFIAGVIADIGNDLNA